MQIIFLAPYPAGIAASQRFRFEQYFSAIENQGWSYAYAPFIDLKTWHILHKPGHFLQKILGIIRAFGKRWLLLFGLKKYDFVFIHREAAHIGPPFFEWIIAKILQKKIIYDFDDAIWLPNYSAHNRFFHRLKYYRKVLHILPMSEKISAGNAYLGKFAQKYNPAITINPTTIDTSTHHNRLKNQHTSPVVIGWTGTLTTIRYLMPLLPILEELAQTHDFLFHVIANENPEFSLKPFRFIRWKKETEIADLLQFHIGLMPLADDEWAAGKCGFKALQYMALGIPPLVSPVGVNTEIVTHRLNGFVCRTPQDWMQALKYLLESPEKRSEIGQKAREKIEKNYSVEANTANFLRLFAKP